MTRNAHQALTESKVILATWCVFCALVLGICAQAYLPANSQSPANAQSPANSGPTPDTDRVSRREGITEVEASERGSSAPTLVPTVLGFPRWIFWGIAMPWFAASTFTIGFALRGIRLETNDASEKHQQAIGNTSGEPAGSGGDPR